MDTSLATFLGICCWAVAWGAHRAAGFSVERGSRQKTGARVLPAGSITQAGAVQVTGKVGCKDPILEPLTQKQCVYIRRRIEQEIAVPGKPNQTQRRFTKPEISSVPFRIEDSSGRIQVLSEGATIEARELIKRPRKSQDPEALRETIVVDAILIGEHLSATAYAEPRGGGMVLTRDAAGKLPFLLSVQTQAGAESEGLSQAMPLRLLAAAMAMFGLVCFGIAAR